MFGAKANESLQVLVAATAADGNSEQAGEAAVLVLSESEEEKKPAESVLVLSEKARNIIVECRATQLSINTSNYLHGSAAKVVPFINLVRSV